MTERNAKKKIQKITFGRTRNTTNKSRSRRIFSWAMSHICANGEYRSQVGATNRSENIVIPYVSVVSLSSIYMQSSRCFQFSTRYSFFNGLSLRLRADIFKVTGHEKIHRLYVGTSPVVYLSHVYWATIFMATILPKMIPLGNICFLN
jgi:hypothetical protein